MVLQQISVFKDRISVFQVDLTRGIAVRTCADLRHILAVVLSPFLGPFPSAPNPPAIHSLDRTASFRRASFS
jgi:hypothetical protein